MIYLNRNNTSYPTELSQHLRDIRVDTSSKLKHYQYVVKEFMTNPVYALGKGDNGRGLLIYHDMGTGKTILSIAIAAAVSKHMQPIVIVPKSLQDNYKKSIAK